MRYFQKLQKNDLGWYEVCRSRIQNEYTLVLPYFQQNPTCWFQNLTQIFIKSSKSLLDRFIFSQDSIQIVLNSPYLGPVIFLVHLTFFQSFWSTLVLINFTYVFFMRLTEVNILPILVQNRLSGNKKKTNLSSKMHRIIVPFHFENLFSRKT